MKKDHRLNLPLKGRDFGAHKERTERFLRLGWVVDVQNDFMLPEGRLYVKKLSDPNDLGAKRIYDKLSLAVKWMKHHCDATIFTGDWHGQEDPEISVSPDFTTTFPPHCMGRSENQEERVGAELHPCVDQETPRMVTLPLNADRGKAKHIGRRLALHKGASLFIEKNEFDVFTGAPQIDFFLESLTKDVTTKEAFVCGVATDVCVKFAVDGLVKRGFDVYIIQDAIYGLGIIPAEELYGQWLNTTKGFVTTNNLHTLHKRKTGPR